VFDQRTFLRTVSAATADLVRAYDTQNMLDNLCARVTDVLGLSGSGVTLQVDGRLTFVTALDERVAEIERVQEAAQEGPCVDCSGSGTVVVVSDIEAGRSRWPRYTEAALEHGLRAAAGIPMTLEGKPVGALNLYSLEPREWPEEDLEAAQVLADIATAYLVNASKLRQQEQLSEQLSEALASRVVIEQAKGMVAASSGVPLDEAFQRIRAWARNHNQPLRGVARDVVDGRLHL